MKPVMTEAINTHGGSGPRFSVPEIENLLDSIEQVLPLVGPD